MVPNDHGITYDYFLPSLNVRFEVNSSLQFRVAYSKGLAPPDLGLIRNYFPIALTVNARTDANGTVIPIELTPVAPVRVPSARMPPSHRDRPSFRATSTPATPT